VPSEGDEAADGVAIDGKLLSLRKQSGTLRVVNGRGLRRGDTAICDFDAGAASGAGLPCAVSCVLSHRWVTTAKSSRAVTNYRVMCIPHGGASAGTGADVLIDKTCTICRAYRRRRNHRRRQAQSHAAGHRHVGPGVHPRRATELHHDSHLSHVCGAALAA